MSGTPIWFEPFELAQSGGALLVHLALKATVLLFVALIVVGIARRSSAALRHTLWTLCCLALLLLPAFTLVLPAWQPWKINLSGSAANKATTAVPTDTVLFGTAQETTSVPRTTVAAHSDWTPVVPTGQKVLASLFLCWLLGALVATRKLVLGFVAAKHLQSRGDEVDEGPFWDEFVDCAASLDTSVSASATAPRLLLVDDEALPIPLTWGLWRPVVLMPESSLHWPASCRRAALLHELSHIRRLDWLIQSLASLTCLFYWFHPLAWFASGRLRLESERATDDHVLASGLKATEYSSSLLEIVRFVGSHRESGIHQKDSLMKFAVPLSGTSKIEMRLRSILDPKQSRSAVTKKLFTFTSLVAFAAVIPLAAAKEPAEADEPTNVISVSKAVAEAKDPDLYVREAFASRGGSISIERTAVEGEPDVWREVVEEQKPENSEPPGTLYGEAQYVQAVRIIHPAKKRVVTGFKFTGNTVLKDDELQKALVSKTGVVLSAGKFSADISAIRNAYAEKGLPVQVKEATQDAAGVITYHLLETQTARPIVTGFAFTGNTLFTDDELRKLLVSKTGVVFNPKDFETDFIAIRKAYAKKGADVDMKDASTDDAGVVSYNLLENRPATGFKFTGNTLFKDEELQKLLVSKTGVLLRQPNYSADAFALRIAYSDKDYSVQIKSVTQDEAGVITYNLLEKPIVKPAANDIAGNRPVTGFKFIGNTVLTVDDLQKVIVSKMDLPLNRERVAADVRAIQKAYSDKGFAVLVQNASQDDTGVITYALLEAKLTQIKIEGLTKTDTRTIRELITTPVNQPFSGSKLRQDLSRVYDTKLFEDATFKIDDDPKVQGGVIATFMLKEKTTNP